MPTKNVRVKAVAGRIARADPRGEIIPHDRFVSIPLTNYVKRLIDVHGDLVVEETPKDKPAAKPVAAPAPTPIKE